MTATHNNPIDRVMRSHNKPETPIHRWSVIGHTQHHIIRNTIHYNTIKAFVSENSNNAHGQEVMNDGEYSPILTEVVSYEYFTFNLMVVIPYMAHHKAKLH